MSDMTTDWGVWCEPAKLWLKVRATTLWRGTEKDAQAKAIQLTTRGTSGSYYSARPIPADVRDGRVKNPTVILRLTLPQAQALSCVIDQGWADGDHAEWLGNKRAEKICVRAIDKLTTAIGKAHRKQGRST